jgi:Cys-tRNA(Pro)/Cys-tRNA(Cys) deacylase
VSTPATAALTRAGLPFQTHTYAHDPTVGSYGEEAVAATGVEAARVFKTLLVETGSGLAVGIVPVSRSLDLKALASALRAKKVTMADPAVAERSSGYVVGGISPIGQRKALPTVLDDSARQFPTVYVSGGRRGLEIELAPEDLATATRGTFASIAR